MYRITITVDDAPDNLRGSAEQLAWCLLVEIEHLIDNYDTVGIPYTVESVSLRPMDPVGVLRAITDPLCGAQSGVCVCERQESHNLPHVCGCGSAWGDPSEEDQDATEQ